jgi:hypothetical protein
MFCKGLWGTPSASGHCGNSHFPGDFFDARYGIVPQKVLSILAKPQPKDVRLGLYVVHSIISGNVTVYSGLR